MALPLWIFLLLLTPLMAAKEEEEPDPNISGEAEETGKKGSLLCPQEKVLLPSCCSVALYLYRMQDVPERTAADVHTRAQDIWVLVGFLR